MKQNKGYDELSIDNNDVDTMRRVANELIENINKLLNRIIDLEDRVKILEN